MKKNEYQALKELVFTLMCGESNIPCLGITNEFEEGSDCDQLYSQLYTCMERICMISDFESDMEHIQAYHLQIAKHLCMKMFDYGWRMAQENTVCELDRNL